jgi:hypothetical protein
MMRQNMRRRATRKGPLSAPPAALTGFSLVPYVSASTSIHCALLRTGVTLKAQYGNQRAVRDHISEFMIATFDFRFGVGERSKQILVEAGRGSVLNANRQRNWNQSLP